MNPTWRFSRCRQSRIPTPSPEQLPGCFGSGGGRDSSHWGWRLKPGGQGSRDRSRICCPGWNGSGLHSCLYGHRNRWTRANGDQAHHRTPIEFGSAHRKHQHIVYLVSCLIKNGLPCSAGRSCYEGKSPYESVVYRRRPLRHPLRRDAPKTRLDRKDRGGSCRLDPSYGNPDTPSGAGSFLGS